jgi:hypothetical protein
MVVGSVVMSNIRRIQQYTTMKSELSDEKPKGKGAKSIQTNIFSSFLNGFFNFFLGALKDENRVFSC